MGRACSGEPRSAEVAALRAQLRLEHEARAQAERAVMALYAGAPRGVLGIHLLYGQHGRASDAMVHDADAAAASLLGLERREVVGRRLRDLTEASEPGLAEGILAICLGESAGREAPLAPSPRWYLLALPEPTGGFTVVVIELASDATAPSGTGRPVEANAPTHALPRLVPGPTGISPGLPELCWPSASVYLFPEPALSVDTHGVVLAWNAAATAAFGWTEAEVVGTTGPAAVIGSEGGFSRFVRRIEGERQVRGVEGTLASRDRGAVAVTFSAVPLMSGDTVAGAIIVALEATRSLRLEQEVREARDEASLLAWGQRDAFVFRWQLGEPGPSFVSASAERVTGYTASELTAAPQSLAEGVHSDDWALFSASLRSGRAMRQPVTFRWRRRDGQLVWIEQVLEPYTDESGVLAGIRGMARDVSQRVAAQESARRAWRTIAEWLAHLPVIAYRVEWHGTRQRLWVSGNVSAVAGRLAYDLQDGLSVAQSLAHPDDLPRLRQHLEDTWRLGSGEVECRWQHADGTYHRYRHTAVVIRRGEAIREMRGIAILASAAPDVAVEQTAAAEERAPAAAGWRRVVLAVPAAMAGLPSRPVQCPHCGGHSLMRHQSQHRLIDDGRLEVESVRYRCGSCGRTFTEHPSGVSRSSQTEAVRRISILLYGLGLSLRQVAHVLARSGVNLSPSSVRRNALPVGAAMRRSLPSGARCVLAEEETPATGTCIILERVILGGESDSTTGIILLVWSTDTDLLAWLRHQAAILGMDLTD